MAKGDRDSYHPSPAELDRFLLGEMSPTQAAPVLAHLLHGCEHCQMSMRPMAAAMFETTPNAAEPLPSSGAEYDFPLFKAFSIARRYAATAVQPSKARIQSQQVSDVQAPKEVALPATSDNSGAERDWLLCQRLIERCRALRHSDPETLVLTAQLAVELSQRLEETSPEKASALADLQACALAELGNARRIADDLVGAEAELSRALERAAQGAGDPLFLAALMDLTASLYTDLRRFEEARCLLDAVYAIYERAGDRHAAGRALISKGASSNYAFDVEEAIQLLTQGLSLIDPARDPKLAMIAIHNLIWSLVEGGRAAQAHQLFEHSRQLLSSHTERLDAIKTTWLEGRIAMALGEEERAEQLFRETRAHFEEARLPYEVALVSLDTAVLWLRAGRVAEIRGLIDETISIFQARGIRREAIGMMLVVRDAFRKRQVTETLLRTTAAKLQQMVELPSRRVRVSS
jgi:tetratricopeptide (TPR) repeat protein